MGSLCLNYTSPCGTCFYVLPNGTCYTTYNETSGNAFDFLILNPETQDCPSAQGMLLWFVTYNAVTVVVGLYLGSIFFRTRVLRHRVAKKPGELPWPSAASLTIQIAATVGSSYLLAENDPSAHMPFLVPFWFARPLATPFVLWLSRFCPDQYNIPGLEVAMADGIYGLFSAYAFGSATAATQGAHLSALSYLFEWDFKHAVNDTNYESVILAGSAIGLGSVILWAFISAPVSMKELSQSFNKPGSHGSIIWSQFWIQSIRCLGCWLMWASLLLRDPGSFCPSQSALLNVLGVTVGAAIIDNLWRGL